MINHLSHKFAELYNPHRELAVDEAMIKFQGRSCLKQYNCHATNTHKEGHQSVGVGRQSQWILRVTKFEIYTGKDGAAEKGFVW